VANDEGVRRARVALPRVPARFTELERLYLLERVDKYGARAPLTVLEALGVVTVRADDATVCPIDYLDLDDPDLQPLRRCAAASGAAFHAQCFSTWA
jgi:hypothetical protein